MHLLDQRAIQNDMFTCSADFVNAEIVDKIRTLQCSQYSVKNQNSSMQPIQCHSGTIAGVVVSQVMKCISDELSPVYI